MRRRESGDFPRAENFFAIFALQNWYENVKGTVQFGLNSLSSTRPCEYAIDGEERILNSICETSKKTVRG